MKICLVTSVYALSDEDRHASFLVESTRHLVARGYEVKVFAPSYKGCRSHTVEGVEVRRFRYFPARWEDLTHGQGAPNRIRNPLYLFVAIFYVVFGLIGLIRFARSERFDLLHVHWPFPHGLWGLVLGLLGTPMVLTFHGAELLLARRFSFVSPVLKLVCRQASGIICNSSFTAKQVALLTDKPVTVVPFGAAVTARPVHRDPMKPVKDILYVGRLIERKGVTYLLDAMPEVLTRLPARLHIVGEGPLRHSLEGQARGLGIESAVLFHGFVPNEELEDLYAAADLFVLPAIVDDRGDTEGLGVVLVEAMSFATPVVASDVGGISDVVQDGVSGNLTQERSANILAQAMVSVLSDPALAARLGAGGLARARDYFDWNRVTDLLESVYRSALRPSPLEHQPARG